MAGFDKTHVDFKALKWIHLPRKELNLKDVALGLIRLPAGKGYTFTHRHERQEEVYIVLEGKGQILLDGELHELEAGDLVRVSPETSRALKAHEEHELFVICAGALPGKEASPGSSWSTIDDGLPDFQDIPPWYEGVEGISETNTRLEAARNRARASEKIEKD